MHNPMSSLLLAIALLTMSFHAVGAQSSKATPEGLDEAVPLLLDAWTPARPLLLGEVHGTREVPALVAMLIGRRADGASVLLMLELPESEQAAIDTYLASAGTPDDFAALLAGPFWNREGQDGRSSVAMAGLLASVHALRADGRDVAVVAFAPSGESGGYSARMADNFRRAVARHPGRQVLSLGGNYHSQVAALPDLPAEEQPLGWQVRDLEPLSIAIFAHSGAYWGCSQEQACGEKPIPEKPERNGAELKMADGTGPARWHGRLFLEGFSASAPSAQAAPPGAH